MKDASEEEEDDEKTHEKKNKRVLPAERRKKRRTGCGLVDAPYCGHWGLRRVLGGDGEQAGSRVESKRN